MRLIKELFIHDIKENKIHFIAVTLIIMLYGTISVGMFDPDPAGLEAFQEMIEMMPEAMVNLMGFDNLIGPLVEYLSNYLYGFIMIIFPMIYIILVGNRLVSRHNDKGSMIYIITMPYSRRKIISTQAVYYITSFTVMYVINVLIVILMSALMFPGNLDIGLYLMLNLVTFSVHLLLSSVVFLISTAFSEFSLASGISSGLLMSFFVLMMLGRLSDKISFLNFFTPYSLIDIEYILEGGGNGLIGAIFSLIGAVLIYLFSIEYFNRKSIII